MRKLTRKFVSRTIEPDKCHDGDAGLSPWVKGATRKSFVQRIAVPGRRPDIGLGSTRCTAPPSPAHGRIEIEMAGAKLTSY